MRLQLKRSLKSIVINSQTRAQPPQAQQLEYGEIAINYWNGNPSLFIKDDLNQIRQLSLDLLPDIFNSNPQPTTLDARYLRKSGDTLTGDLNAPNFVGGVARMATTNPATGVDGELWWNSDDGRLYVYYNDGSTAQWVDASPDSFTLGAGYYDKNESDARYLKLVGGTVSGSLTLSGQVYSSNEITSLATLKLVPGSQDNGVTALNGALKLAQDGNDTTLKLYDNAQWSSNTNTPNITLKSDGSAVFANGNATIFESGSANFSTAAGSDVLTCGVAGSNTSITFTAQGSAVFSSTIQASDFLDANGNSITADGNLGNGPLIAGTGTFSGLVTAAAAPSADSHLTNKQYVDGKIAADISAINLSGISTNASNISTNTSNISANTSNISTNTSNISTNTSNINGKLSLSGGTLSGDLLVGSTTLNANGNTTLSTDTTGYLPLLTLANTSPSRWGGKIRWTTAGGHECGSIQSAGGSDDTDGSLVLGTDGSSALSINKGISTFSGNLKVGTNTIYADSADGGLSIGDGAFRVQASDGAIASNVKAHGSMQFDSTGEFTSPQVTINSPSGNIDATSFSINGGTPITAWPAGGGGGAAGSSDFGSQALIAGTATINGSATFGDASSGSAGDGGMQFTSTIGQLDLYNTGSNSDYFITCYNRSSTDIKAYIRADGLAKFGNFDIWTPSGDVKSAGSITLDAQSIWDYPHIKLDASQGRVDVYSHSTGYESLVVGWINNTNDAQTRTGVWKADGNIYLSSDNPHAGDYNTNLSPDGSAEFKGDVITASLTSTYGTFTEVATVQGSNDILDAVEVGKNAFDGLSTYQKVAASVSVGSDQNGHMMQGAGVVLTSATDENHRLYLHTQAESYRMIGGVNTKMAPASCGLMSYSDDRDMTLGTNGLNRLTISAAGAVSIPGESTFDSAATFAGRIHANGGLDFYSTDGTTNISRDVNMELSDSSPYGNATHELKINTSLFSNVAFEYLATGMSLMTVHGATPSAATETDGYGVTIHKGLYFCDGSDPAGAANSTTYKGDWKVADIDGDLRIKHINGFDTEGKFQIGRSGVAGGDDNGLYENYFAIQMDSGDTFVRKTLWVEEDLVMSADSEIQITAATGAANKLRIKSFDNTQYGMKFDSDASPFFTIKDASDNSQLSFDSRVGTLVTTGAITGNSTISSDLKFKSDIVLAPSQLSDVVKLGGLLKTYYWNESAISSDTSKQLGLIAQEVEDVCPDLVSEQYMPGSTSETFKTIDQTRLIMKLLGAVKELSDKVTLLESYHND